MRRRAGGPACLAGACIAALAIAACVPAEDGAPAAAPGPPPEPAAAAVVEIEAGSGAEARLAPESDAETAAAEDAEEGAFTQTAMDLAGAEARLRLGRALEATGEISAAVDEYEAAVAVSWPAGTPIEDTPLADLARICGRAEPAEAVVRACARLVGSFRFAPEELAGFLASRADARARLGQTAGALKDYATALEIESTNFQALVGRARLRIAAGQPARALNDLRLAMEVGARPAEARLARAEAWRALGQPERAVDDYDAVLANFDAKALHAAAWRARGETHCAMGRAEAAAVDWQVWAAGVPGGASYLQEMLRARGYLRGPWEARLGPATLAGLRAWTEAGCP